MPPPRLRPVVARAVPRLLPAVALAVLVLAACSPTPTAPAIQTLQPGVVKIAITGVTVDDPLDPEQWMYHYAERLAQDLKLRAEWQVVPFDKSWELAGKDVVDVVATNLASFPDRVSPGGTFSVPFLYELDLASGACRERQLDDRGVGRIDQRA